MKTINTLLILSVFCSLTIHAEDNEPLIGRTPGPAYVSKLIAKYGSRLTFNTQISYDVINSFEIDCHLKDRRYVPLINLLYATLNEGDGKNGWLVTYADSEEKEVRIYNSVQYSDGKQTEPHVVFTINEWGELRPVGIRKEAILTSCFGSHGPIWVTGKNGATDDVGSKYDAGAVSPTPEPLQAPRSFQGKCFLEVNHKTYLDGSCPITMENDGGFSIGASENEPLSYFAIISITGKNTSEGFWNEEKGANHAHTSLGNLVKKGACWQNENAKVCAWKWQAAWMELAESRIFEASIILDSTTILRDYLLQNVQHTG